ncbi:MAG: hypothetical protein K9N55_18190, partial [Phycisphaerae bacterium]|nr:hypothetical protein [Phycisphaerae bacterium]
FPCVAWEYGPGRRDRNNTYYFPVTDAMRGKALDVVVLSLKGGLTEFQPEAWLTTYSTQDESLSLRLED